ncbi:hypothetical protein ACFX4N_23550 [Priestia sp. YIM B13551]|uniref:hypothetical protein n=1 Tax=Priestia sp. YIM B13551 TaxID=3366306 RepID=UPI00366B9C75
MAQQENLLNQQIDINILMQEYEQLIAKLTSENLRYKTLFKQINIQLAQKAQQDSQQATQHPAPPAAPEVPVEKLEDEVLTDF